MKQQPIAGKAKLGSASIKSSMLGPWKGYPTSCTPMGGQWLCFELVLPVTGYVNLLFKWLAAATMAQSFL